MQPRKPTKEEVAAAEGKSLPDVIGPGLDVVFCGINPGLYTAAIGHHFGRPGNRFWPVLHLSGFTPRLLTPYEERELLELGYGITNVVDRATAAASALTEEELVAGGERLRRKIEEFRPRFLAVLGIGAYRSAFRRPRAMLGEQPEMIGPTRIWVLPNPSGLNANYQMPQLVAVFRELHDSVEAPKYHHAQRRSEGGRK